MAGLDLAHEDMAPLLNPGAAALLAIVPLGELGLLLARSKRERRRSRGAGFWYLLFAFVPPVSYGFAVLLGGLPRAVIRLGLEDWILTEEVLLLLPYLVISALGRIYKHRYSSLFQRHRTHRLAVRELVLGFRGEIALIVPLLFFVLACDLLSLHPGLDEAIQNSPTLLSLFLFAAVLLLIVFYPPLLKILWGLERLNAKTLGYGKLHDFLKAQGYKVRDVLEWNTGGLVINAAILGFLPPWRYIMLTDTMLRLFEEEEIIAVVAHEIGHGKKRHTSLFVFCSLAFMAGLALVDTHLRPLDSFGESIYAAGAVYLPIIGFYVWGVFGFLSRRFEVEADIYAVRAMNEPTRFIRTLDRLGSLSRMSRRRKSWRHFSIDKRIAILRTFFPEHDGAPGSTHALTRFERRVKGLKIAAMMVSSLLLILFFLDLISGNPPAI